jgi:hypothetical protein
MLRKGMSATSTKKTKKEKSLAEQEKNKSPNKKRKKNTLDRGHRAIRKQLKKKSVEEKTFVILNLRYPSLHICR